MATCRKIITRQVFLKDEKGDYTGETKEVESPGFSQLCALGLDDGHPGPCASPADPASTARRQKWQSEEDERQAEIRHQESGLARVQSRPKTVASIVEGGLLPHSSSMTKCVYCPEMVMFKNMGSHISQHAMEQQFREAQLPEKDEATSNKQKWQGETKLVQSRPSRPTNLVDDIQVIQDWVVEISKVVMIPAPVKEALDRLS